MLATIFVTAGAQSVQNPDRLVPKAKPLTDKVAPLLARSGLPVPTETRTLVQINGAVQVVGGLMLMTPLRRLGAVALAGSLIPTTLAGHSFWTMDDPTERAMHRTHFLKNLGLLGGTLLAAADNNGNPGLRWRAGRLAADTSNAVHRTAGNAKSKAAIARKSAKLGRQSATFGRHLAD
jgi:putative oxidoreductase